MKNSDNENTDSFDLNRYRQAADIAYRYAKDKIERERLPKTKEEEDAFSQQDKTKVES